MDDKFLRIAITEPEFMDNEASLIVMVLDSGFNVVHLRKPGCTEQEMRDLIESIPQSYYRRLRLHDHLKLSADYGLLGVHLNSRNPRPPEGVTNVSRSCHSLEELQSPVKCGITLNYQTLSPIFDSISKPGYRSAFDLETIGEKIAGLNVIALGGVTPDKFPLLKQYGFIGAAMLGAVWQNIVPDHNVLL